jgi:hypothetical protein
MYLKHKILLGFVWIMSLVGSYCFAVSFSFEASGQVLTVLSIFFGFYVTGAALIAGSDIYSALHNQEDERGNKRLSHTLRDYYKFGFSSLLIGILLFLIISLFLSSHEMQHSNSTELQFSFTKLVHALSAAQLSLCLTFSFVQTRLFIVLFGNEAYMSQKTRGHQSE